MNELLVYQWLTILGIYITGYLSLCIVCSKMKAVLVSIIAYFAGLSLYGLIGMALLITGVPFNRFSILMGYFVVYLLLLVINRHEIKMPNIKWLVISVLIVAILGYIATSGMIPVSLSNDSMYYYSLYPQTIAIDGRYDLSYDVFLTDVGQSVAVINTLPFFFGFNETFGIQSFMMISFICFFMYLCNRMTNDKRLLTLIAAVLISTTSILVMTQWILANAYFMEFVFAIYGISELYQIDKDEDYFKVICMLMAMASMMRTEGGVMAGILIMCISLMDIKNNILTMYYVLPSVVLIIPYYLVLYVKFRVNPLYSFLDVKNAIIQVAFLFIVGIYVSLIRGKILVKLQKRISTVMICGLLAINALLFVINHEKYIENISAFIKNIVLGNGWGYFGFFVLICLIMLPLRKSEEPSIISTYCICFILTCIALLFARDGALRVGSGDSGNRVLLQISPFILYAIIKSVIDFKAYSRQ